MTTPHLDPYAATTPFLAMYAALTPRTGRIGKQVYHRLLKRGQDELGLTTREMMVAIAAYEKGRKEGGEDGGKREARP